MTHQQGEPRTERRFGVSSPDGTVLTVWALGKGQPVVLVHGSLQDHTIHQDLAAELSATVATYSMDRRGFGASGDAPDYSIDREFADVAAVVDAVADEVGGPVAVWGHSYGANCAMGAAVHCRSVSHLVLYEPSLGQSYPPGSIEAVEQALARGDPESALLFVLAVILELPDDYVDALRGTPVWRRRLAAAHTIPRELRAEQGWRYEPGQFDTVTVRTLLLSGSETTADLARSTAAARSVLPHPQFRTLKGHGHIAHRTDPAMVATIVREFLRTPQQGTD